MTDFVLSQILATIAFACGIVSFQYKGRRAVLCWLAASAIINACHFFVLDRPGPGTLYVVTGIRLLVAAFSVNRKLMYVFLGLVVAGFCFSYTTPLDFLGLFATLLATYASFQEADQKIRILFMIGAASWTVHNILAGTPVAALKDATLVASNAIGYWRFYRRKGTPPEGDGPPVPQPLSP